MEIQPKTEQERSAMVQDAMQNAVDFVESEISDTRLKAQRYYDGEVDIGYEDGRSKVVATKVRDVVRSVKPSIMRVFMSTTKAVEFVPHGPEDVAIAEQATSYVSYKFQQHDGYRVLNDVFQDAMVKKAGIAYVYYNEEMDTEIHTFTNLTDEEFAVIIEDDDVEVLEHEVRVGLSVDQLGVEIEVPEHDVKIARSIPHGDICIESIPPEDFFVDRNARGIDNFYVCGHSTEMRVSDLIAMGFSPDDLA